MVEHEILSVSALTLRLKELVEAGFPHVCVEGEISNLSRATSGHIYLTLKDEGAQIRAVLWRSAAARIRFELHDGLHVVAIGPIEVYAARGSYQLVIESLAPQGIGPLELAFRQRYEKLAAEGLFRLERKRPLPRFPRRIALVTSPAGAAVRDMLQVITRRWPACDIIIVPVAVQGQAAAAEITAALRTPIWLRIGEHSRQAKRARSLSRPKPMCYPICNISAAACERLCRTACAAGDCWSKPWPGRGPCRGRWSWCMIANARSTNSPTGCGGRFAGKSSGPVTGSNQSAERSTR